jgi:hypothetical protein
LGNDVNEGGTDAVALIVRMGANGLQVPIVVFDALPEPRVGQLFVLWKEL